MLVLLHSFGVVQKLQPKRACTYVVQLESLHAVRQSQLLLLEYSETSNTSNDTTALRGEHYLRSLRSFEYLLTSIENIAFCVRVVCYCCDFVDMFLKGF